MAYRGAGESRLLLIDIHGERVGVFVRSPTPSEYIGYHREKVRMNGSKIESNITAVNIKYGLKVITGVRKGDLEYRDGGVWKVLDTDAMSESEWRTVLERDFFELLDFVGSKVFNPTGEAAGTEECDQKKSLQMSSE